ncbi:MAG: hypothetical protein ETSY2_46475 [Candidatus Entotheonella gemina]|uniref:Uncharacterized protein n=1 Tax=Candidatus Entotheonella gemina TaxID=1429439 RepID=W4LFC4_9BACT|nr:MAG: hypothetical protein ETSY2_46475 [Candidatus Entotheonella gemina]
MVNSLNLYFLICIYAKNAFENSPMQSIKLFNTALKSKSWSCFFLINIIDSKINIKIVWFFT